MPLNNGGAELNTTHAHRNTAIALKTRMLLAMGRTADVITEADNWCLLRRPTRRQQVLHTGSKRM
ncbi:MAG: hypothetical protein WDO71_13395 [Bacteroidota bacterium]